MHCPSYTWRPASICGAGAGLAGALPAAAATSGIATAATTATNTAAVRILNPTTWPTSFDSPRNTPARSRSYRMPGGNVSVATALPRIDERPRHERDSRLRRPGRRHGQCDRQSIQPAPGRGPDNAWQENQYDLGCPRTFSAMKDRISCSVTGAILGSIDSRNSRSTWNSCA